jgi:hypothetical protein
METKGISMIYRPAPQQAYLCLLGILSKASCLMELANSLDIEWSQQMSILKFSSIIEHANLLSDLMSCPCFVLSS